MVFGKWRQTGKVATVKKKVKAGAKSFLGRVKAKLKAMPGGAKKLISDKKFRGKIGKQMGVALKRKAKAAAGHIKEEYKEFKAAGGAIKKAAQGKKLNDHDKHALKGAIKAVALTVTGTILMGGIGHLAAQGLAQHFAAEAAVKAVGKAALFASILEEDEAAFDSWVEKMINDIADKLGGLGEMSDEELSKILGEAQKEEAVEALAQLVREDFPNRLAKNIISHDKDRLPMRNKTRWMKKKRGSKKGVDGN